MIVFYSQGYRIDYNQKTKQLSIIKTGGIYFETNQNGCKLYIDGKLNKNSVNKKTLIENLKPGIHNFVLKKEGFQNWEKNLEIKVEQVTDAKEIMLFENNYDFQGFSIKDSNNFFDFYRFQNGDRIILLEKNGNDWSIISYNPSNKANEVVFSASSSTPFYSLEFQNQDKIIVKSGKKYFSIDLRKNTKKEFLSKKEAEIFSNEISGSGINIINNSLSYLISDNNILYLAKDGFLYRSDLTGKNTVQLSKQKLNIYQNSSIKIKDLDKNIFVLLNLKLYALDQLRGQWVLLGENVKDIILSPDKRKMAINASNEIFVFYLQEQTGQVHYDKGQKAFLDRFSTEISQIQWLDDYHLIANFNDGIKALGIDNRDRVNISKITSFYCSKFIFVNEIKKILILKDGKTQISEKNITP